MSTFIFAVALILWGGIYFLGRQKQADPADSPQLEKDIKCPSCDEPLHLEEMLDSSVFFGWGAVVFDCIHCNDRVYFAPYPDHVETGTLGCSPVIDPIPRRRFTYPADFDLGTKIENGFLNVQSNNGRRWEIPRFGLWNERTDVPEPHLAGEKKRTAVSTSAEN